MSHNSYPLYKGLFITRLLAQDDKTMPLNQLHIDTIRACKNTFGPQFLGGLEQSDLAQQLAPDLILPELTRDLYLQLLHENFVCIAPKHPHGTLDFAEFLAAGRALVAPPPSLGLPGQFKRGNNFVIYTSPEECVRRLGELLSHTPAIHRMEAANFAYYNMYVRPDAMIKHTLQGIL